MDGGWGWMVVLGKCPYSMYSVHCTEAEFLYVIWTKAFRVFLLAIHSRHLLTDLLPPPPFETGL
jgi:hypothetical protein